MLKIDNLEVAYGNIKAIKSISLKINQGEKIFIEGENGSGKSTLIRILAGLMSPTSGSYFINDDTFRKIDLKQFRSQIGIIIKDESPFEGTILENLTLGDKSISQEAIRWAIEAVQLSGFIKTLPEGIDSKIFPEGRQLSSSNKAKILLARSIVHKPKVLFYEDPTESMDIQVANQIIDFITSESSWTVIVSSKNLYWKEKCNRNLFMEKGIVKSDSKK